MSARLAVNGVAGRMGRAITEIAAEDEGLFVTGAIEASGSRFVDSDLGAITRGEPNGVRITSSLEEGLAGVDAAIDFTHPTVTPRFLEACVAASVPAVVGTTGLDEAALAAIDEAVASIAVEYAPNMSVGVNVLFHLAARAAELLGPDFDAEIFEIHHRRKVDAPSGTAVRLGEVVATAKGLDPKSEITHGRSGQVGARPDRELGIMTLRGGDVVGEHTLYLVGEGERIELTHRATDRRIFARGALRAAKWVVGRPSGRYDMADVLGIPR